eukprot:2861805-Prymnesium_polylepis.1
MSNCSRDDAPEYYEDHVFKFEEMVFWCGKDESEPFEEAAARVDTIVTGPHAGFKFPESLRRFINPQLTRRNQHDYSDVATGPVGRKWATCDDRVIFIENPAARIVTDANRAPSTDISRDLHEFYRRADAGRSTYGVDAVRPVTFNDIDVLRKPTTDAEWADLVHAIERARLDGPARYNSVVEDVLTTVVKLRGETARGRPLTLICLHDTDNFKCAVDGSLTVARPLSGRLPTLVCLGNCGDQQGNGAGITMSPEKLRRLGVVWAEAFSELDSLPRLSGEPCQCARGRQACACAISFNKPYPGGYEVKHLCDFVRSMGAPVEGVQVEFLRSVLHGPVVDKALRERGAGYPKQRDDHAKAVAARLRSAANKLRVREQPSAEQPQRGAPMATHLPELQHTHSSRGRGAAAAVAPPSADSHVTIFSYGSLLDPQSAARTMPSMRNHRPGMLSGWRRVFSLVGVSDMRRGRVAADALDCAVLAIRPVTDAPPLLGCLFEIPRAE